MLAVLTFFLKEMILYKLQLHLQEGTCGSIVVKVLCYKPERHRFDTR
jgi:hypothetical protein